MRPHDIWPYMVSFRQEQHSIMNFAVAFLNLLTLYMLWRAQFLTEFYAAFCIYQILIFLPLWAKILDQMVSQKVRIIFLLLAIFQAEKKNDILTSKLYKVTKSAISPQR